MADIIDNESNNDEYFTAALIHRIGEVPLFLSDKEKYMALIEESRDGAYTLTRLEMDKMHINSCLIGEALLNFWKFPEELSRTARHSSSHDNSFSDLMVDAVTLSDSITVSLGFGIPEKVDQQKIDQLLKSTGLSKDEYDYFISEAYLEKLKSSRFFKECQSTLNVNFFTEE